MKKLLMLLVIVVFFMSQLVAQTSTFNKGDKVLNLGILGLGSSTYSGFNMSYFLSTSFEVGIIDNIARKGTIGVGGFLGFSTYKNPYLYYSYRYSDFIIGGRGTFHYPLVDKLDTYAGLMLGYDIGSSHYLGSGTEPHYDPTLGGFVSILNAGVRYYFSRNFAAMSELGLGYGTIYLSFGGALKF
jgi:hypothetical protein